MLGEDGPRVGCRLESPATKNILLQKMLKTLLPSVLIRVDKGPIYNSGLKRGFARIALDSFLNKIKKWPQNGARS